VHGTRLVVVVVVMALRRVALIVLLLLRHIIVVVVNVWPNIVSKLIIQLAVHGSDYITKKDGG
jgi:hypothetical protein